VRVGFKQDRVEFKKAIDSLDWNSMSMYDSYIQASWSFGVTKLSHNVQKVRTGMRFGRVRLLDVCETQNGQVARKKWWPTKHNMLFVSAIVRQSSGLSQMSKKGGL
jgi:hypothetical protein